MSNLDGSTATKYEIPWRVRISRSHVLVLALYTTIPKMVWETVGCSVATVQCGPASVWLLTVLPNWESQLKPTETNCLNHGSTARNGYYLNTTYYWHQYILLIFYVSKFILNVNTSTNGWVESPVRWWSSWRHY